MDEAERRATCALAGLPCIGPQSLELLRQAFGSLAEAARQGGQRLSSVPGLRADGVASLAKAKDLERRGAWLIETAKARGFLVLVRGEDSYPAELAGVSGAPEVLYVHGRFEPARRVAIVGSRHADDYGIAQTRRLAADVCRAGLVVMSGGAEGVDKAAHDTAMALGGTTVAVVGTGLLNAYPSDHRDLYERIARHGAVVSEFPLDAGGQRHHFPQRNRTMAALASAVVVTRGTSSSGALSTCTTATRLGRPVFAVPGRVGEEQAAAPNGLLASGEARAWVGGDELFRALDVRAPAAAAEAGAEREAGVAIEALGPAGKRVYGVLGPHPRHVDELAPEAGLPTAALLAELLRLELAGLCASHPGMLFARR